MPDNTTPPGTVAAVLPVTPAVGRIVQQAPQVGANITPPSALLALGASTPTALTYDASGLLRAVQGTPGLSSGVGGGSSAAVDAAALTGVNVDAARSGMLNSPVSLQAVPANALGAVQGLLAGQSAATQAASLSGLQVDALNGSVTGLDNPSSAAAVLNATGALQSLTPDQATAAIAALGATDLGATAAGLNVNSSQAPFLDTTGLLLTPGSDSTSQALSGLLTSSLSLANAGFSANLTGAPAVTVGNNQALSDVLASDVNLTTAAAQASAATATVSAAGIAATTVALTPATPVTTTATAVTVPAAAIPLATVPTIAPVAVATPVTPVAPVEAPPPVVTLTPVVPAAPATTVNLNFLVDAAAQAANNIASNPSYAAMAANLYVHAAVARVPAGPGRSAVNVASTDVANLPPPVAGTLGIRAARRI